jgi:hypothetical protein
VATALCKRRKGSRQAPLELHTVRLRDFNGVESGGPTLLCPPFALHDLGGLVDLIGLCRGGWLSLVYAGRFPAKYVSSL